MLSRCAPRPSASSVSKSFRSPPTWISASPSPPPTPTATGSGCLRRTSADVMGQRQPHFLIGLLAAVTPTIVAVAAKGEDIAGRREKHPLFGIVAAAVRQGSKLTTEI